MDVTAPAVLQADGVLVIYPGAARPALADVSLAVLPGEGVALLGANGAGKTTLLRAAMALLHPARGSVRVAGRDTAGRGPEDLADVAGFLFQQPESQLFERTVRAEVAFGPRQLGWDPDRIAAVTAELLSELALTDAADLHPYDLPAPRRRVVALAATLAARPRLLLLDEPTAGLDRAGRHLVVRAVRRLRGEGVAVVAVSHDAEFALEALDRGVVLQSGQVVADGAIADVLGSSPEVPALPPVAELALALGLAAPPLRFAAVAGAVAVHCRSRR